MTENETKNTAPAFSLLMAVYNGNTLSELEQAIQSSTIEQTLPPSQVVIVRDGPVSPDIERFLTVLQATLNTWFASDPKHHPAPRVTVIAVKNNSGLAHALNIGLAHCKYEYIARADCDDISLPDRFAKTIPILVHGKDPATGEPYDVVGSSIQEYSSDTQEHGQVRMLPADSEKLAKFAILQSPIHHPSAVLRKSAVIAAGGYPEDIGRFEDYMLWERMMLHGSKMTNIPDSLVLYRTSDQAYQRRGGWAMFKEEWRLQRQFLHDHFINFWQFLRNVSLRAFYRVIPTGLRKRSYRGLVNKRNSQMTKDGANTWTPAQTEIPDKHGKHRAN